MKKLLILTLLAITFTSCSTSYKVFKDEIEVNEDLTIKFHDKIKQASSIQSKNYSVYPEDGNHFYHMYLTVENKSGEEVPFNFTKDLKVVDINTEENRFPNLVSKDAMIKMIFKHSTRLKAGKDKKRIVTFQHDKKIRPESIFVLDKKIKIPYRD